MLEEKNRLKANTSQKTSKVPQEKSSLSKSIPPKNSKDVGKNSEIEQFLKELNLSQYTEIFTQNGFEEMEILKEITPELLTQMKIPPGHQIKIMKALKRDVPREVSSSQIPKRTEISSSQIPRRTDLIELPEEDACKQNLMSSKENFLPKKVENVEKQSNANGMFKHSNSFQMANKTKNIKNVSFKELPFDNLKESNDKQKDVSKVTRNEVNGIADDNKVLKDEGTGTSPRALKNTLKMSCWNCFKLFENESYVLYEKNFCSIKCQNNFLSSNELICERCQQKKLKSQGVFRNNLFFCSEQCAPKLEELYKIWFKEIKEPSQVKEIQDLDEPLPKQNIDFDLFSDLKILGNKSKDPLFLSMTEIEDKYKDFNSQKK